jgi:hypothetical protein
MLFSIFKSGNIENQKETLLLFSGISNLSTKNSVRFQTLEQVIFQAFQEAHLRKEDTFNSASRLTAFTAVMRYSSSN